MNTRSITPTAKAVNQWPFLCLGCHRKAFAVAVVYTPPPNPIKTQLCEWCLASQGFDVSDPLWRSEDGAAGVEHRDVPVGLGALRVRAMVAP